MIEESLKNLGFGEKEIKIYLAMLQYGKIAPGSLAQAVKLNRATVYSVAKELVKKGVIAEDLGGPNMFLVAKPPQNLKTLADREAKALEEKRNLIGQAITELQTVVKNTKYPVPKIVFMREDEIEKHLYEQTPIWADSIRHKDNIWWGFQDHTFVEHYEKWIDWSWESGIQKGISLKLISNEEEQKVKKKTFPQRVIKFWGQSKNFTASTWICGDYVVMLNTRQKPFYLVEIFDELFAYNQREVFKGIWNTMGLTE